MARYRQFRNLLRPNRLQGELERELGFHLTERAEELRLDGMTEAGAERAARRQFASELAAGGAESGEIARVFHHRDFDARTRDRREQRSLFGNRCRPAAPVAVALLLITQAQRKSSESNVAPVRLHDWDSTNSTLMGISGYFSQDSSELSGELPETLRCEFVAPRFLEVLGVAPALGRDFKVQEERFGGPTAAIISDRLWRHGFNGSPDVLGKTLRFETNSFPIVGVMPPSFHIPDREGDVWIPSPAGARSALYREPGGDQIRI